MAPAAQSTEAMPLAGMIQNHNIIIPTKKKRA